MLDECVDGCIGRWLVDISDNIHIAHTYCHPTLPQVGFQSVSVACPLSTGFSFARRKLGMQQTFRYLGILLTSKGRYRSMQSDQRFRSQYLQAQCLERSLLAVAPILKHISISRVDSKTMKCRGRRGMSAPLRLNASWLENCVRQDCDISHSE